MGLDCACKLRREEEVLLIGWVVDVDKDAAQRIRLVQVVVDVGPTALLSPGGILLLVGRLAADPLGIIVARAQLDHIWAGQTDLSDSQ